MASVVTVALSLLACNCALGLVRSPEFAVEEETDEEAITHLLQTQVSLEEARPDDSHWKKVGVNLALLAQRMFKAQSATEAENRAKEKADAGAVNREWLIAIIAVESLILFITMGLPLVLWAIASFLGRSIKFGIETLDRLFIGTDVTIKRLETNIFQGVVVIDTLEIKNPEANKYSSPYLLKAGLVHIDLDMAALICSFFRHVKIERLEFKSVDVIYEKGWNSSNVQDVLNFLQGKGAVKKKKKDESESADETDTKAATAVTLHEVAIEDVGARVQAQMLGGRGMRVSVGDIFYKDFQAEVGESAAGPIIQVLLKSVLKTVIVNIAGKEISERCL